MPHNNTTTTRVDVVSRVAYDMANQRTSDMERVSRAETKIEHIEDDVASLESELQVEAIKEIVAIKKSIMRIVFAIGLTFSSILLVAGQTEALPKILSFVASML